MSFSADAHNQTGKRPGTNRILVTASLTIASVVLQVSIQGYAGSGEQPASNVPGAVI